MEKFVGVFCQKGPKFLNKVLATVPLVFFWFKARIILRGLENHFWKFTKSAIICFTVDFNKTECKISWKV
jgi:hypothetical protein